jgi:hypothetical protein
MENNIFVISVIKFLAEIKVLNFWYMETVKIIV